MTYHLYQFGQLCYDLKQQQKILNYFLAFFEKDQNLKGRKPRFTLLKRIYFESQNDNETHHRQHTPQQKSLGNECSSRNFVA